MRTFTQATAFLLCTILLYVDLCKTESGMVSAYEELNKITRNSEKWLTRLKQ
jgi:hypothetical protein